KKQTLLLSLIFCGVLCYSQQWAFLGFPGEEISAVAVHPVNPDIIFVSGANLYKSSDGGLNWDTVSYYSFNSIVFHSIPDTMYATLGEGSNSDGIYKSIDGGDNWNILEWIDFATSLMIPGYPSGTIVAGTKGMGVYESSDYGNTWVQINDSLDNLNVLSLSYIDPCDCDSGQTYFAGTEGGIFYYHYDFGGPWNNTNTATNVTVPAISSDRTCYLWAAIDGGSWSDGMYKSTYGGTWNVSEYWPFITDILINPLNLNVVYAPNTVYAADSGYGVKRTVNGGISWQIINAGLSDSVVYCLAQSRADTTLLYAGTSNGAYVLDFSTEIKESSIENYIIIYPNPSNDKIQIESMQNASIEIIDLQGKIIQKIQTTSKNTTIDLKNWSSGVYTIKAKSDKGITVKKLIKQ
ncbi:MAG: T9SS type A sorting domain-containing protein, partial [Bacteroidia bacterium]|nr:T9SS type A sorting domain-containing protein [Bacteroidia bacterium]